MPDLTARLFPVSATTPAERATWLALTLAVALSLVSIAASQIMMLVAFAGIVALWRSGKLRIGATPSLLPMILLFVWTVLAALASADPLLGLGIVKKFYIYLILVLAPTLLNGSERITKAYHALFLVALLASVAGIAQFIAEPGRDLLHRISGFMGHWMTYSGHLMLVLVAMGSYLVAFGLRRRVWIVAAGLLVVVPLVLTQTRSAQLGALAGLGAILVLKKPRWLPAMCVAVLALYLALPRPAQERIRAGWDPADPNTRNRIELAGTSLRLVRDHPWFGVGPKNVAVEALRYRGTDEFPDWMYQHMHNNFLQIAAERGLPGLLLWIWFMGRLAWDAWILFLRASRKKSPEPREIDREALLASTAAVGAWVALLVAGLFEYNFGDSEILTIFLFMMSTVYSGFVKQPLGRAEPAPIALEQPVVRRTTGGKSHP